MAGKVYKFQTIGLEILEVVIWTSETLFGLNIGLGVGRFGLNGHLHDRLV